MSKTEGRLEMFRISRHTCLNILNSRMEKLLEVRNRKIKKIYWFTVYLHEKVIAKHLECFKKTEVEKIGLVLYMHVCVCVCIYTHICRVWNNYKIENNMFLDNSFCFLNDV